MINRHESFAYPNNNLLLDGVNFEEDIMKFNFGEVFKDMVFFRPTTQQVMLDKFKTDVVYYGGMDPWNTVYNTTYNLILNMETILQLSIGILLICFYS